ncbi:MAG: TolC family protein [Prevotella sp.]|uniref:TolC family protein n=1 Tax=Prevotella sp. PTAC TaxID=2736295 RepID=UPI0015555A78|nr:TolC family protein [Prevotella sp. PTAC]MCX4293070.1 TolC family protein [Prevotella sp.]NPD54851.1 TolC family protein [Prevotella sp. PTAC]
MNNPRHTICLLLLTIISLSAKAQFNNSGISAGFFDSSENSTINFSKFHLPPLAVLFENAKSNPQILDLAKAQEIAQAEVAKQKRHIFSYLRGHASYSYGKTDMWGNNSSTYNQMIYQFQGSEQNYWNVGVNLNIPLEDILDLGASVKRKRLLVEQAQIKKDIAYDQLKLQIASLYVKITNDLVSLKTASENAAIYQGAGALNQEDFHQGNMNIEAFAYTKLREQEAVSRYQNLQTQITTDIITLEILTHTPIITNTTTDITLDSDIQKSDKQVAKENKAVEKQIKKNAEKEQKRFEALEKADKEAQRKAAKEKPKSSGNSSGNTSNTSR